MQISSNIVRFPVPAPAAEVARRTLAHEEAASDNVVAFVPPTNDGLSQLHAQEYGKIFTAHRMATRVADELDAAAVL